MIFYILHILLELLKYTCGSTFFWCLGVSIISNVSSFDASSCKSIFIIHLFFLGLLDLQKHMLISILISTCMSKCSLPLARLSPSHSHKLPFHRDKLQDLDQLEEAGFFSASSVVKMFTKKLKSCFFCGQWMLWACAASMILVWLNHMCDGYRPWRLWRRLWQSEKRVDLGRVPVEAFWDSQSLDLDLGDSEHSFASWPSISRFLIPATCEEYGIRVCPVRVVTIEFAHACAKGSESTSSKQHHFSVSTFYCSCYFFDQFPTKMPPNGWVMCMCICASSSPVPECDSLYWGCKPPAG